jgi:hypothetical protein
VQHIEHVALHQKRRGEEEHERHDEGGDADLEALDRGLHRVRPGDGRPRIGGERHRRRDRRHHRVVEDEEMRGQRLDPHADQARRDDAGGDRVGRGRRHAHAEDDRHQHREEEREELACPAMPSTRAACRSR